MDYGLPIILLDESTISQAQENGYINAVSLELGIFGGPLHVQIGVRNCPARLADIVPAVWSLSKRIGQCIRRETIRSGYTIPCRKGCSACCNFLVTLSVPEAFYVVEEVMATTPIARREYMIQSCRKVIERVEQQMPEHLVLNGYDNVSYVELKSFSSGYASLEQPCPFLQNSLCAIYEQRPILCRDWLVVGSATQCQLGKSNKKKVIRSSLRLGKVLKLLTSELEHKEQRGVFLYDVFNRFAENRELCTRTWPAVTMVEHFVDILCQFDEQGVKGGVKV